MAGQISIFNENSHKFCIRWHNVLTMISVSPDPWMRLSQLETITKDTVEGIINLSKLRRDELQRVVNHASAMKATAEPSVCKAMAVLIDDAQNVLTKLSDEIRRYENFKDTINCAYQCVNL